MINFEEEDRKNKLWKAYREEIEKIRIRHNSTNGVALNEHLGQFQTTYEIYYENFKDLHKLLEDYHRIEFSIKLWEWKKDERVREYLRKVLRSFHNYIGSVGTLIDHSRVITEKVAEKFHAPEFIQKYKDKIKDSFVTPRAEFMRRFRNYCLHSRLAPIRASTEMRNGEWKANLFFIKESLQDWDGWTALSREFITGLDPEQNILPIVYEYSKSLHEFNVWYGKQYAIAFAKEFEETNQIRLEMNEKIKEMNEKVGLPSETD